MPKIICCNKLKENYDKMILKIKKKGTLLDLRNILEKKMYLDSLYFLKPNGNYFPLEEEKNIFLKSFKNNIIYFSDLDKIKIISNKKFLCDISIENISLNKLRIKLGEKINPQNKFFFEDAFILDEENFKVFEICNNNVIEIKTISEELFNSLKKEKIIEKEIKNSREENIRINNFKNIKVDQKDQLINRCKKDKNKPLKLLSKENINYQTEEEIKNISKTCIIIPNDNQKNIKRHRSLAHKNKKEKKEKYILILNGKILPDLLPFEFTPDTPLSQVRKDLPLNNKNYIFLYDGYPIGSEETKISEIAKDNKIYLKYEDKNILKDQILNICKKLNKNSIYNYYVYPNIQFNEEEDKKCISLLLLGETGAGKTTFLNALINFVLKVDYSNNLRFLLVNEEGQDNFLSQTKQVNIYYIKSHNSYPPIKVIDTPGFGDTQGHDFDKKIIRMIFEKFKEIKELSSICILCKFNEGRLNFNQHYIFNSIINLFGKDMAENFIILFSFCDVGKILSKICFEEKDSPFSKIINKMKEPWYLKFNNSGFFSEKKNEFIEEFYKMGDESFKKLFNKLKTLEKRKLKLSSEVNIKREKIDNITLYVKNQIICLSNYKKDYQMNFINNSIEYLYLYYCNNCNFFSNNNNCIICKKPLSLDYEKKYFNFNQYSNNPGCALSKYYLEIYSNLFKLENLMVEYNNITLKNSNETVKGFLFQIQTENSCANISQQISEIIKKYEEYRTKFFKQVNNQKVFALFLFNQLIK